MRWQFHVLSGSLLRSNRIIARKGSYLGCRFLAGGAGNAGAPCVDRIGSGLPSDIGFGPKNQLILATLIISDWRIFQFHSVRYISLVM